MTRGRRINAGTAGRTRCSKSTWEISASILNLRGVIERPKEEKNSREDAAREQLKKLFG